MPELTLAASELLRSRGRSDNLEAALGAILREATNNENLASRLSDRLGEMQIRLEAASADQERQYGEYLTHIGKVRELLDVSSEADLYEAIRAAKNRVALCSVALSTARGGRLPTGPLLRFIGDHADSLAGLHTKNAALFRERLIVEQALADRDEEIETLNREIDELRAAAKGG